MINEVLFSYTRFHNAMFESFKSPIEASYSLLKQCEIQRECVRYTECLAVKHLGFLTRVHSKHKILTELKEDERKSKGTKNRE